jgi:hypothetical protein
LRVRKDSTERSGDRRMQMRLCSSVSTVVELGGGEPVAGREGAMASVPGREEGDDSGTSASHSS